MIDLYDIYEYIYILYKFVFISGNHNDYNIILSCLYIFNNLFQQFH